MALSDIDLELVKLTELYEELVSKREVLLTLERKYVEHHNQQSQLIQRDIHAVKIRNQDIMDSLKKLQKDLELQQLTSQDGKLMALTDRYLKYIQVEIGASTDSKLYQLSNDNE